MKRKFNRRITDDLLREAEKKTHMSPERAYEILKSLRDHAIVEDARTTRQGIGGVKPTFMTTMQYKALKDAIRLLGIRRKLMYIEDKAS